MKSKLLTNITPGEILEEEFLKPMAITQVFGFAIWSKRMFSRREMLHIAGTTFE